MLAIKFILRSLMSLVMRTTISIKKVCKKLPSGSFVLVTNHQSHADLASIMLGLGISYDELAPFAAEDYFFTKEKYTLRSLPRYIFPLLQPVSRFKRKPKLLSKVVQDSGVLDSPGRKVYLVYPEGTRNPRSVLTEFKPGFVELARTLELPILPVYISGSGNVLPKGSYFPTRAKVGLNVGEPFMVNKSDKNRAVAEQTREKIQNLRAEYYYNKKLQEI